VPAVRRATHTLDERIRAHESALAPAELRAVRYFAENRATAAFETVGQIARSLKMSTATIVRGVQALGYDGIPELKQELHQDLLATRRPSIAARLAKSMDELAGDQSGGIDEIVAFHTHLFDQATRTVRPEELHRAIETLDRASRIVVLAHPVYRGLADYFALDLMRIGRQATAIGEPLLAEGLLNLGRGDVLVLVAYTEEPWTRSALRQARQLRVPVVLVTDALALALKGSYTAVINARRGEPGLFATGIITLLCLEILALRLAARDRKRSLRSLAKLDQIRSALPDT
jgi:DNA-binding MurR/RpiR family transcriptional regulator